MPEYANATSREIRTALDQTRGMPRSSDEDTITLQLTISRSFKPILEALIPVLPTKRHFRAGDRMIQLARAGLSKSLNARQKYRKHHGYTLEEPPPR